MELPLAPLHEQMAPFTLVTKNLKPFLSVNVSSETSRIEYSLSE